ncbi:MAG: contact-dependent growth inhibition system immunity protein, partial [Armatimonadota bacterium]
QEIFLEHVLPVALKQLQNDPLSGEQWDGDLAYDIARISKRFWQSSPDLALQAKKVLESQDYSFSDLTQEEVNSFLQWMSQQQ